MMEGSSECYFCEYRYFLLYIFRSKGGAGPLALPGNVLSLKSPCGYSGTNSQKEIKPPEPDDSLIVKVI